MLLSKRRIAGSSPMTLAACQIPVTGITTAAQPANSLRAQRRASRCAASALKAIADTRRRAG